MPGFYMKRNTGIKWVNRIRGTSASSATLIDNIFTNYTTAASEIRQNQEFYFRSLAKIQIRKTAVKKRSSSNKKSLIKEDLRRLSVKGLMT